MTINWYFSHFLMTKCCDERINMTVFVHFSFLDDKVL